MFASSSAASFRSSFFGAAPRWSAPVVVSLVRWDAAARSISCVCADGRVRVCRVDRLSSVEFGRGLWSALRVACDRGLPVSFAAAGGFSPDRWFCDAVVSA